MSNLSKYFLLFGIIFLLSTLSIYPFSKTKLSENYKLSSQVDSTYTISKEKLNVYSFSINDNLSLISLPDYDSTFTTSNEKIDINVNLDTNIRYADIYIFINKQKIDLYYNVNGGVYAFRGIRLFAGINNIEVFYVIGNSRSQSSSILINKE
ncbi:MAG: hypothetical protein CO128_02205 [Ignavibacteriales bacterium CG_4_9_14_3_um_filter_30_11]|nr:MAG: hypothetical protein CO128_02205 [Ignavibacteriales bacterium CG_4_9_14_3_um_filter_30_11]